jgi:hypothetical protein
MSFKFQFGGVMLKFTAHPERCLQGLESPDPMFRSEEWAEYALSVKKPPE